MTTPTPVPAAEKIAAPAEHERQNGKRWWPTNLWRELQAQRRALKLPSPGAYEHLHREVKGKRRVDRVWLPKQRVYLVFLCQTGHIVDMSRRNTNPYF
jgi:hypothetical protein